MAQCWGNTCGKLIFTDRQRHKNRHLSTGVFPAFVPCKLLIWFLYNGSIGLYKVNMLVSYISDVDIPLCNLCVHFVSWSFDMCECVMFEGSSKPSLLFVPSG